ncbi:MAG: hypothetical protein VX779_02825 [Candidatus Thermoplasmatota archaeon]|nr:hypothetical protein [Candidatus Thermoplasmatota archaeon]
MSSVASGWYARLDHVCPNRIEQLEKWLDSWEEAVLHRLPVAATMPPTWPTLPAGLISDPGAVLEHLLARNEAVSDGRSPRGAYSTPDRLVGAVLADELNGFSKSAKEPPATLSLAAMPPGFRAYAEKINQTVERSSEDASEGAIQAGEVTRTGIPLPISDPSVAGGVVPGRLLSIHVSRFVGMSPEQAREDTLRLLRGLQMADASRIAVTCARRRIMLVLARSGLVDLQGDGDLGRIGRKEVENLLNTGVRHVDALRGDWPWQEAPRLLVSRPPWLRIKDRFRGYPEGSAMRKQLSKSLRNTTETDGSKRFSALRGNVNLYRLFIERAIQLVREGGKVRMIVPDTVLREKSSVALRKMIIEQNQWISSWSFPEPQRIFPGTSQGVSVIGIEVGGKTEMMTSFGPLRGDDISTKTGLDSSSPFIEMERGPWSVWTDMTWAVPRMPRDQFSRRAVLKAIDDLADQPRLGEEGHWLNPSEEPIRVRVGEVDQSKWSSNIHSWEEDSDGVPFIRGSHFLLEGGRVSIQHPAYDSSIEEDATERIHALWSGPIEAKRVSRVACQAIVNAQKERRLRWAVVPPDCVLGNSVNYLELPEVVLDGLAEEHGGVDQGLLSLAEQLNSDALDLWSRAWAANNNVNNYEIERLPLPPPSTDGTLNYELRQ